MDTNRLLVALDEGAILPTRAHEADAGLDLYSREAKVIAPRSSAVFDTGVHVGIWKGYVGLLMSKSGLNVCHDTLSDGVIDADYTGSITVKLYNHGDKELHIAAKQKISQLLILPIIRPEPYLVDALEETERGTGGFGSTGKF